VNTAGVSIKIETGNRY